MSTKFTAKYIQDLFAYPPAFGEGGEGEIVGIDFSQT